MLELPSGRHLATDFVPLEDAFDAAWPGKRRVDFMSIKTTTNSQRYIRILWLLPIGADSEQPLNLMRDTLTPPDGSTPIDSRATLATRRTLAAELSPADMQAIESCLNSERHMKVRDIAFQDVREAQERLAEEPCISRLISIPTGLGICWSLEPTHLTSAKHQQQ
jgi:hypothetical protein